jgi:exosome complex protein LRP1
LKAGNNKWDLEQLEQQAKERARAHIKFTERSEKMKQDEISTKRKLENADGDSDSDPDSDSASESGTSVREATTSPPKASKKKRKQQSPVADAVPSSGVSSPVEKSISKKMTRKAKKAKKEKNPRKTRKAN